MAAINEISIFNTAGLPSVDFITEVQDSQVRRRNELYFALMVKGLPGDPTFGIGLDQMIGDLNDSDLGRRIRARLTEEIPALIENIEFNGAVIAGIPEQQLVGVDIYCTDLESGQEVMTPVAVKKEQST